MSPLGIAIVGCGQIADAHLAQIAAVPGGRVVAVCDTEPELAEQAADRFGIATRLTDLGELLAMPSVDVVHLCTPVRSHAPLAIRALEAGKHVYVEKPFTVDAAEAREVVAVARRESRKLCLGHDQLFDPVWRRARAYVDAGRIGRVVHVESVLGYPIGGAFGREVAADPNHWVRSLPGGLFQNTLSHPLYRLTEFIGGWPDDPADPIDVQAHWMRRIASIDIPTEMRVHLADADVTGTVTFLSRAKPPQRISRLYGDGGILEVDYDAQTVRHTPAGALPGAFEKLQRPLGHAAESLGNVARSLWSFARSDIHYFAGMRNLFAAFYDHIRKMGPEPIAMDEMVRVTAIMDAAFASARESERSVSPPSRLPQEVAR